MEQLTTYRAQGKEIGLVFLFKYDLNGNLKLFEISEAELNEKQIKWLFSANFPATEDKMKTVWMKDENYTKVFTVEVSPADLSFDALWILWGGGSSKQDAIKAYGKLKPVELIKCFVEIPYYFLQLKMSPGTAKLHLSTYINKRRYEDDRPQVAMKVGKVFNPMLKDLASKKTNK